MFLTNQLPTHYHEFQPEFIDNSYSQCIWNWDLYDLFLYGA